MISELQGRKHSIRVPGGFVIGIDLKRILGAGAWIQQHLTRERRKAMKRRFLKIACSITVLAFLMVPVVLLAGEKINLNTATLEELMNLKRIGPKYAQRIIDYRQDHGPFEKIEDIVKVKGIGRKTLEANKDILTVD